MGYSNTISCFLLQYNMFHRVQKHRPKYQPMFCSGPWGIDPNLFRFSKGYGSIAQPQPRVCLLIFAISAMDGAWVLEQPRSSALEWLPCIRQLWRSLPKVGMGVSPATKLIGANQTLNVVSTSRGPCQCPVAPNKNQSGMPRRGYIKYQESHLIILRYNIKISY